MQLSITVADAESDLDSLQEGLRGIRGVERLARSKTDQSTLSIYDTLSLLVQTPQAAVAIGTGIGALFAALGNRARVTIRKDGTVIAERVSSKDAATIVAKTVAAYDKPHT